MRKFKCYDCDHTWELSFGQGGRGMDQVCPDCGSKNIHRSGGERGRGSGGRGNRGRGLRYRRGPLNETGAEENVN